MVFVCNRPKYFIYLQCSFVTVWLTGREAEESIYEKALLDALSLTYRNLAVPIG